MMNIKLYSTKARVFPDFIDIGGVKFPIDADFRNILKILAMMKDRNIPDMQKVYKIREWFVGESNESDDSIEGSETADIFDAAKAFGKFLRCDNSLGTNQGQNGQNEEKLQNEANAIAEADEPQFCYEFDACEIYSSFLSEYNIDLIECGFLHWYKFRILLDNLSEASAFKRKIALRFMDVSEFSRDKSGKSKFSDIVKAWQSVQLPVVYSDEEMQEIQEFEEFWGRV